MRKNVSSKDKISSRQPSQKTVMIGFGVVFLIAAVILIWRFGQPQNELVAVGFPGIKFSGETGIQLGQIAPDFTVPTLENTSYTLSDQGEKPTIVFFMAYWCGSCIPEARALTQLQQEFGDQISIIAIDLDQSSTPELLKSFKDAADSGPYAWGFDVEQHVTLLYEVQALDTTLILDRAGHVVYRDAFPTTYGQLKTVLEQLGL